MRASSNAGNATVRIAGQAGTLNSFVTVSASSSGTNSVSESSFNQRADGTSDSRNSSTNALSGGAGLVTIVAGGRANGGVSASGDASATVDNAGTIGGIVFANSGTSLFTSTTNSNIRTITNNAGGGSTQVDEGTFNSPFETLGGTASVINRAGATITGNVQSNAVGGTTLSNDGTIGGRVFLNASGTRNVQSGSSRTTTTRAPAAGGGGVVISSVFENNNASNVRATGGAALVDVSATGRVAGGVSAISNAGPSTIRIAGQVGSASDPFNTVVVQSSGTNTTSDNRSVDRSDGSRETSNSSTSSLAGGAALASIAATGNVLGNVSVFGDTSSTIDNAGRIGGIFANSNLLLTTSSANTFSRTVTTSATGVRTQVDRQNTRSTDQAVGGTASVVNRAGASIGGTVSVSGLTSATLDNAGTIARAVDLRSTGFRTDRTNNDTTTTTSTPAATGGATTTVARDVSGTTVVRATGGTVTGTYSGTVGVANAQVFTGQVGVTQTGTTASTATVTSTIFGSFNGNAGGTDSDGATTFTSRETIQPNRASARDTRSTSTNATTQIASTSSLTVGATGRIANGAFSDGFVSLNSAGGNATFTLDGGSVASDVSVTAASGTNVTNTSETTATFTRAASLTGAFVPEVQQSQSDNTTFEERQAPGAAIVRINSGTVGDDLLVRGGGTGVGSLGADVLVNGTVAGGVAALSTGLNERTNTSTVTTRTGPAAVNRTIVTDVFSAPSTTGGGVLVAVGGTVGGGVIAGTDVGNATVNVGGSVGSLTPDGVTVRAFDFGLQRRTTTTQTGTDFGFQRNVSSVITQTSTASGGAAALNVAANAATRAAGTSSVEGDISIAGFAGSALNVAAGSRIVQNEGTVFIGTAFINSTSTTTNTFAANGALTGTTETSVGTIVGGPSSLNNAGIIGSTNNLVDLNLFSVGPVTAVNTGTINGSIITNARSANRTTTTVTTDANDLSRRRTVQTTAFTAIGNTARVDNSGLVTGGITANGVTGIVNNSGVVRGTVTLGGDPQNFTSVATTTFSAATPGAPFTPTTTTAPLVANSALFAQTYTLNQNGLLIGGVNVAGVTTADPAGGTIRTGNVTAAVNLNDGSITLGNITAAPGATANVNLNGSGFLGIPALDNTARPPAGQPATGFAQSPAFARFTAIDPTLGTGITLASGVRVSGVQTLTKAGGGTFVIVGAPGTPASGTTPANFTLDVGTLRVNGGELQIGLANAPGQTFSVRGNVENSASFVIGQRIVNGTQSAIQGINVSVGGNLTNAAAGSLVVGVNPSFVRAAGPAAGGDPFRGSFAFVPFGPQSPGLASTNSFVRVDGNLNLAGNVSVQTGTGGLFEAGRLYDLFNVGGTFTNTGTVQSNFASPFVGFTLTPRSEGGRTIVSLNVVRNNFDTVTTDGNSAAAAGALQGALPGIFAGIRGGSTNANAQDLAGIVAALDTQLTRDQSAQLFRELASGAFYGSLSAVSTTIPFGEATDGLSPTASGVGLWFRPTGQFAKYKANRVAGASEIDVSNYGGSIGLNYGTGSGGNIGIAGGYGRLDVDATTPEIAEADTYMIGVYGSQQIGGLHLSGQVVYGQSEWTASRDLTLLGRRATASFDSKELRGSLRAAYTLVPLPGLDISPFARIEARRYDFDGFTEAGAGAVALTVQDRQRTVLSPELGVRMSGALGAALRPFAEGSYIFQNDVRSDRLVNFVGAQAQSFTLEGVDPGRSIKAAIGVVADVGAGTIFVRGDYASGGRQQVGTVRGGLLFNF